MSIILPYTFRAHESKLFGPNCYICGILFIPRRRLSRINGDVNVCFRAKESWRLTGSTVKQDSRAYQQSSRGMWTRLGYQNIQNDIANCILSRYSVSVAHRILWFCSGIYYINAMNENKLLIYLSDVGAHSSYLTFWRFMENTRCNICLENKFDRLISYCYIMAYPSLGLIYRRLRSEWLNRGHGLKCTEEIIRTFRFKLISIGRVKSTSDPNFVFLLVQTNRWFEF